MKRLLTLLLIFSVATAQAGIFENIFGKKNRNKKGEKTTLSVVTPAPAPMPEPVEEVIPEVIPQESVVAKAKPKSIPDKPKENLTPRQIDSLVSILRERQTLESFEQFFADYIDVSQPTLGSKQLPDSVFKQRLHDLVSPVQLPYNDVVRGYINRYVDSRYGTISRILSLSQYYFPLIEQELINAGLPVELRALPIIESALSPTAVSPMGATGLWQFMPATGKVYGLEINSLIDERRDPLLATRAACRFLKDLYDIFGEWSLAIAAYNCGQGNVTKAIARAGGECRSFWDIYDYLPRETRGYVPAFIGASYAYAYHQQHGINFSQPPMPLATDTVRIDRLMHLSQVTSTIDVSIETLRQLNPQYKLDIIPATNKEYTLVLPQRQVSNFVLHRDTIFAKDSMYLKEYINPANISKHRQAQVSSKATRNVRFHAVKRGDTLGAIASKYRVTTSQLMRWNKLRSAHKLSLGQKLRIEGR